MPSLGSDHTGQRPVGKSLVAAFSCKSCANARQENRDIGKAEKILNEDGGMHCLLYVLICYLFAASLASVCCSMLVYKRSSRSPQMSLTLAASFLCIDSYQDHYGLEDVKERILEHIAVNFLQDPCFACHLHPNDWTVRVGPHSLRLSTESVDRSRHKGKSCAWLAHPVQSPQRKGEVFLREMKIAFRKR